MRARRDAASPSDDPKGKHMIHRRQFMGTLATVMALPALAALPHEKPISKKAAKAEFHKLLDWLMTGDVEAFRAYGDIRITQDKKVVEDVTKFVEGFAPARETKEFRPFRIESFDRTKSGSDVFLAVLEEEQFSTERCYRMSYPDGLGMDEHCYSEPNYIKVAHFWFVKFDGPRVSRLVHQMTFA